LLKLGIYGNFFVLSSKLTKLELPDYEGLSKSFRTGRLERELQMVQLYRYFVSQSTEFCRHNPLCCFSTSNTKGRHTFFYRLSPEAFGYTLVFHKCLQLVKQVIYLQLFLRMM